LADRLDVNTEPSIAQRQSEQTRVESKIWEMNSCSPELAPLLFADASAQVLDFPSRSDDVELIPLTSRDEGVQVHLRATVHSGMGSLDHALESQQTLLDVRGLA
jgi:hypothetical protein